MAKLRHKLSERSLVRAPCPWYPSFPWAHRRMKKEKRKKKEQGERKEKLKSKNLMLIMITFQIWNFHGRNSRNQKK